MQRLKNNFNVNKLLLSKWTAITVKNKQKHFIVTELIRDELTQAVEGCELQAVIDKQLYRIRWQELKNKELWIQGWK
jgi:tryptophan-rich hypothetical protein